MFVLPSLLDDIGYYVLEGEPDRDRWLLVGQTNSDLVTIAMNLLAKTGHELDPVSASTICMKTVTIVPKVSKTCTARNTISFISIVASAVEKGLADDREVDVFDSAQDSPLLEDRLINVYKWDEASANNILDFGGAKGGSTVFENLTKALFPAATMHYIQRAFYTTIKQGPLIYESMRRIALALALVAREIVQSNRFEMSFAVTGS